MRVVTTVHKAGFEVYGERWLAGISNWPKDTEFFVYTEGFDLEHERVTSRRIESVERAESFKRAYSHYRSVSWRWDVIRFCNKTFSVYDALYNYDGLGVWLDADCITYQKLPQGYVESMLPDEYYLARFERQSNVGFATETGFWLMDCKHAEHKRFLDTWIKWYESGQFKTLGQWCDAATMDATVRIFKKHNVIKTVNLSGKFLGEEHPMAKVDLARYIDHLKGQRKTKESSPENEFHSQSNISIANGWWLPSHDHHIPENMESHNEIIHGRLSYQGFKQVEAIKRCKKRRVALDIGAHVGLWSFNLANEFHSVYSFEPVALHAECFRLNVTNKNVKLMQVAVGESSGSVSVDTTPGNSGDSYVSGAGDIPMIAIDSLGLNDVDFIKIDCQGYEENVVKGALETIKRCHPVIIVEQKDSGDGPKAANQFGAIDLLKSIGYRIDKEIIGDFIMVYGDENG